MKIRLALLPLLLTPAFLWAQQPLDWGDQLYYSTDGRTFTPAGEPYSLRMGSWKGSRVGLFCYTLGDTAGGKAQFDHFDYEVKTSSAK